MLENMKYFLQSLRDLALMVSIGAIVLTSVVGLRQGLSTNVFLEHLHNIWSFAPHICLGLLFICIQLAVMHWGGVLMNAALTCTSLLLFAMMTTLALGPERSMTSALYSCAVEADMGQPFQANPALYWLIPLAWFLCLLGAKSQVRTFCITLICYALWVIFTPMLTNTLLKWAAQENPPMQAITNIMTGTDWMPAATFGVFLLVFSLLVGLLDSTLPETAEKQN